MVNQPENLTETHEDARMRGGEVGGGVEGGDRRKEETSKRECFAIICNGEAPSCGAALVIVIDAFLFSSMYIRYSDA